MAHVNKGLRSFTCHPRIYPQVEWTVPAFTPQPQSITALWLVLISRPAEGRRLSWRGWLGEILKWFIRWRRSPIPVLTGPDRVTSLIRPATLPPPHTATLGPLNAPNVNCSGKIFCWRRKMDQTVLRKAVYHKIFDILFAWIHLRLHLSRPRLTLSFKTNSTSHLSVIVVIMIIVISIVIITLF